MDKPKDGNVGQNDEEILKEIDYEKQHIESEGSFDEKGNNLNEDEEEKSAEGDDVSEESGSDEDQEILLSENPYQQVNKNNLLGCVTYVKWMRKYQYYFGIDMQLGRLLLYKKSKQHKPSTYYNLSKGRFDEEIDKEDGDDIIRIRNKKGRRFRLELFSNKDPKKIRELIELCFNLQIQSNNKWRFLLGIMIKSIMREFFNKTGNQFADKNSSIHLNGFSSFESSLIFGVAEPSKGFYATLGRSVMQVINTPFNVASGIIVDMKKKSTQEDAVKQKKTQLEKEKLKKVRGYKQLSSLFFSQSELLKEILGSISGFILNPFDSKALSASFSGVGHFAIGLVFKPISGTIDLIGKSSEFKKDHVIHQNVFKVFKVFQNKKKNSKRSLKEEQERQKRETALEIHDEFMEKVFEYEGEALYLNKKNHLGITKKDIVQLSSLAKGLNLEDVDGTLKVDIQYEQQKVTMNRLLDYYIKNRKEKSEEYEEDMCEFIVLQPIIEKSVKSERLLKGIEQQPSIASLGAEAETLDLDIEEIGDEISDERIGRCQNKQVPLTTTYHQIAKKETFNTILPEFLVRDSPFKSISFPDIQHNGFIEEQDAKKKIVEGGQLTIPFSKNQHLSSDLKLCSDTDDEMQFHSFTNQQLNDNNSQEVIVFNGALSESPSVNKSQTHEEIPENNHNHNSIKSHFSTNQEHNNNNHEHNNNMNQIVEQNIESVILKTKQEPDSSQVNNDNQILNENNNYKVVIPEKTDSQQVVVEQLKEKEELSSEGVIEEAKEQSESSEEEEEEEEDEKGITKAQDKNVYFAGTKADLEKLIKTFVGVTLKDEKRVFDAHDKGGKQCLDKAVTNATRSVGKFIISEVGRKIISGDFNLTTVSFPIKAMIPKSALQTALAGTCLFPIYMAMASQTTDLIERMKLLITATFANFPVANTFLKPLNPILGETFQASYIDGTKLYGEQISHHPPVSYFLAQGPHRSYQYSGYYLYEAKAGWNSLTLRNKGKRQITFKDGHKVSYNFGYEYYSGTFLGTMRHETLGEVIFSDPVNKIEATILTGKVKKKPSDYIQGDIKLNGKVVSSCYGTYLGFIEFDGKRYWDIREILPMKMNVVNSSLMSDHLKRTDRKLLASGQLKKAQDEKERLELIQRQEAALRRKHHEKVTKALKASQKNKK